MDNPCCRNGKTQGVWTPTHVQAQTVPWGPHVSAHCLTLCPFHSSLLPVQVLPVSYPCNFALFKCQSPFLKLHHQVTISLLYQVPGLFSRPSVYVFISSKIIILDILLIAFTFPVLCFLTPCHSLFSGLLLSLSQFSPLFSPVVFFHHWFPQSQLVSIQVLLMNE